MGRACAAGGGALLEVGVSRAGLLAGCQGELGALEKLCCHVGSGVGDDAVGTVQDGFGVIGFDPGCGAGCCEAAALFGAEGDGLFSA